MIARNHRFGAYGEQSVERGEAILVFSAVERRNSLEVQHRFVVIELALELRELPVRLRVELVFTAHRGDFVNFLGHGNVQIEQPFREFAAFVVLFLLCSDRRKGGKRLHVVGLVFQDIEADLLRLVALVGNYIAHCDIVPCGKICAVFLVDL